MSFKLKSLILSASTALIITACGGGGGGTTPTPPPTGGGGSGGSSAPSLSYTPGQYPAEATYKDVCAAPRAGTTDTQGQTAHENFWLRSWSNRTYLWYSELPDRDPNDFSDRLEYFDLLRTTRTTSSGNPVDQFHFTIPTEEYQRQVQSGASASYGARFRIIQPRTPRNIRVAYIQDGTPAASVGMKRGDLIIAVDGVSVINGGTQADVDTINAALFPDSAGEVHTFTTRDENDIERTFEITSETITTQPVLINKVIDGMNEAEEPIKIGYVLFNTFGTSIAEEALFDAFTELENQNVDELVLDLRYNGGGFLDISSELGFMIAGDLNTNGRTYERLVFNDKFPNTNPVTGQTITPSPFYSRAQGFSVAEGTPLPSLDLDRVYIISDTGTCSASESLINGLLGIDFPVFLIGYQTCGKPYGFYATDNCGETYFTIQFRGENDKGFGDYADGFTPLEVGPPGELVEGCSGNDNPFDVLGDPSELNLETALFHIRNGVCLNEADSVMSSEAPAVNKDNIGGPETSLYSDPRLQKRILLEEARIANMPRDK